MLHHREKDGIRSLRTSSSSWIDAARGRPSATLAIMVMSTMVLEGASSFRAAVETATEMLNVSKERSLAASALESCAR